MNAGSFRKTLRGLHRDAGYVVVGLTFVYALSGLAVNHIKDWDPNFVQAEAHYQLAPGIPAQLADPSDEPAAQALSRRVLGELKIESAVSEVYAISETELDITLPEGKLALDLARRTADFSGQKPRPFLRLANWLHTNRGKAAWTVIADLYAVLLLGLATSGLLLIREKSWIGRKTLLVGAGVLVPVLYVVLSGGPAGAP